MTTNPANDASSEQTGWALCVQRPGDRELGISHQILHIRDIEDDEYRAIHAAIRLFNSFGGSWGWNKISTGIRNIFGYFDAADATLRAARTTNSTDFAQIDRALRGLANDVEEWLKEIDDEEADSVRLEEVRAYIRRLGTGTAAQLLRQIGTIPSTASLASAVVSSGIPPTLTPIIRPEALALAGITLPRQALRLDKLLVALTNELEPLAAQLLVAHESLLTAAAARFMSLAAEAVYGAPTLVPTPVREKLAAGGAGLKLTPIPVHEVPVIMRALQVAQHLLHPADEGHDSSPTAATSDAQTSRAPLADPSSDHETAAGRDEDEPAEMSTPRPLPADVYGLLHQASQLAGSIEEQWSAALKEAETWSADLFSQWSSVTHALRDSITIHTERLRQAGIEPVVTFPVDARFAEEIEIEPGPEQEARQLCVAQLYAVTALLDAMQALKQPTAVRFDSHSGVSHSWWESGAFALVRARANVAIKVNRELDARSRGVEIVERPWIEEIATAGSCLSNGLPEAALIYLERALQKLKASEWLGTDNPDSIAKESFAQKVRQAAMLALDGKDVSNGTYLLLANHGLSEIQKMIRTRIASQLPRPTKAPVNSDEPEEVQS